MYGEIAEGFADVCRKGGQLKKDLDRNGIGLSPNKSRNPQSVPKNRRKGETHRRTLEQ